MRMSSIKIVSIIILSLAMLIVSASSVYAESEDYGAEAIAITVIIPPLPERQASASTARRVFPINVTEGYNYEGVRELVRIYELLPGESPEWINTDSFTRNGYYYQIAEIVRRVDVAHTVREHAEVVEIPSATNNLQTVIAGLTPTIDFVDEDGYVGVLHLDIRSIEMTQDGTRSTSRTVSQTREYPHLSNPDISLIPHTITANGRTYTLADVDWRTNTANPIDFNSVAQTFTAVATYTRTATSTVSTGYTTIAEYSGVLTRVSTGDVRFAATFIGTPIVSPVVNRPIASPEEKPVSCVIADDEQNGTKDIVIEVPVENVVENGNAYEPLDAEPKDTTDNGVVEEKENGGISVLPIILALGAFAVIAALTVALLKFKKKADALERKQYEDSANALYSRVASVVERDRNELAGNVEDDADFEIIEENSDEDGDNDD